MQLHARGVFLRHGDDAHIGNDDRVDARSVEHLQILRQALEFVLTREGVAGDVHTTSHRVRKRDSLLELIAVKIPGGGSHAELGAREVHGIRAVVESHFKPLHIPRRGKELEFIIHNSASQQSY